MSDNINSLKTPYPTRKANKAGYDGLAIQVEREKPIAGQNSTLKPES